mgnify:CR=1 FL=1
MSRFNDCAKKIDELAKKAFAEYEAAKSTFEKAENVQKEFSQRIGRTMSVEQEARRSRAHADYLEAQEKMNQVKRDMDAYTDTVAAIRRELAQQIDASFVVDPAQVDTAALELLKSGICGAADFEKLMHDATRASNATMIRLIASYAAQAADGLKESDGRISYDRRDEFSRLNAVGQQGTAYTSRAKLQEFDALADVFRRTMRNPSMIAHWEELTAGAIEAF